MVSGETLASIFAALAQKESESISQNMRMSYKRRMEAGKFTTCKAPFGYRLVDGQLFVEEQEAEIQCPCQRPTGPFWCNTALPSGKTSNPEILKERISGLGGERQRGSL